MRRKTASINPESASRLTVDDDGLTSRERLFCSHYMSNGENGLRAARAAGYAGDAGRRACLLLKLPRIMAVIDRERRCKLTDLDAKIDRVLREVVRIGMFDPRKLFDLTGKLLPITRWPDDCAAVISGLEFRNGVLSKLRFASKAQALELLGRFLNLWNGMGASEAQTNRLAELVQALQSPVADGETPTPVKKSMVN